MRVPFSYQYKPFKVYAGTVPELAKKTNDGIIKRMEKIGQNRPFD